jgi:hypothetical protein
MFFISCFSPEICELGPGFLVVSYIVFVSGFVELLDNGCIVTIVSDYLFDNVLFGSLVSVIQPVGVHSIDHVSNCCVFLFTIFTCNEHAFVR